MRHRKIRGKLSRTTSNRQAMMKNLAISLIEFGQIKTTLPKAKCLRPYFEKLLTKARDNSVSTTRYLMAQINNKTAVRKLIEDIAPNYLARNGGYTRILKAGFRKGDDAPLGYIQLVGRKIANSAPQNKDTNI